ncbi:protein HIRA homolog [Anopheles aquasalis]|uniref:protein HIRA homolog n=1 Tax=Anopheles aquasalis TaxID=42839 RepID=UPI00215B6140|nr:protein HIRA homolog [Anopheles aquasalis]
MKIFQPSWVHHDEKSIFSIDIHPCGERFATGGQGCDSGRVVIWNMAPVVSEEAEANKSIPRILCQMDNHLACVNCVRWSGNGLMLASGGDDKLVMIWKKTAGGGGGFGAFGGKSVEHWRCISTLRGHAGDVLDLAWSPQDRWIASCSVDNTIIIWDAQHFPKIVHVLKGHTGLVKGVTWDPVGKFVASQSDDRSLKVWKTTDWSCFKTITEPFEECGGTTHILRLSWSPDGQYLVSAHAMNGGGPTAQIIERDGWKCDKDFVGHRKAVTCVRFHNSILKRMAPKTNKLQQYCCLAVGARDRSLSIWLTALQRPLVVIHDLFQDSILDLAWSHDGYTLLACSGDGHIACLQFTAQELGTPLSEEDKNILYQRMYGKNANFDLTVQAEKEMIVENSDFLNVSKSNPVPPTLIPQQGARKEEMPRTTNTADNRAAVQSPHAMAIQSSSSLSAHAPILKQIETKTADGKRRITPMFIPLNDDNGGAIAGVANSTPGIVFGSKSSESLPSNDLKPLINDESSQLTATSTMESIDNNACKLDTRLKKLATAPPPQKAEAISNQSEQSVVRASIATPNQRLVDRTRQPASATGKATVIQGNSFKAFGEVRVQIQNNCVKTSYGSLGRVVGVMVTPPQRTEKKLWETVVGSPIVCFAVGAKYAVVCSQDYTIRLLDIKTGTPVFPVLTLTSPAVQNAFSSNSKLVAVLTENGTLRIWNVPEKAVYLSTNCSDILSGSFVTVLHVSDQGMPFIVLANGSSYCYCRKLDSWMLINSPDPIMRHGLIGNKANAPVRNMKVYPLSTIQSYGSFSGPKTNSFAELHSSSWQTPASISFIENQIKICEMISSPVELKYWYSMLGFQLALNGSEEKIRQVLDDLLGASPHSLDTSMGDDGDPAVLGISKHVFMEDILNHFKTQTKWQRIYTEYLDQLKFLKERDGRDSARME